ncbi:hypothetical protein BC828DRAFT_55785 [Blastocladiella britannica]|nr:hypothetical protein BC828DRAFT_55785 [Blastocladiella britannica]
MPSRGMKKLDGGGSDPDMNNGRRPKGKKMGGGGRKKNPMGDDGPGAGPPGEYTAGGMFSPAMRRQRPTVTELWQKLWTFYLLPSDPIYTYWNYLMVLTAVINGVTIPFMAAFRYLYAGSFAGQYVLDLIYLVDIFLKFHVSYLDRGFYVIFPKEMALHYMRSWEFSFDLFSNLPFDLIALSWSRSAIPGEILYFLSIEEKRLNAQAVFQMYKFTIYITLITHWCTCIWYVLACPDMCLDPSWATDPNQNPDYSDRLSMYVYSLYWTVMTMTTTGYGDVHATNDRERVWSIVCMITGVFLYGYVSGTIASSLSNLDSRRVAYRQKVEAIKQYMVDQNMDKDMQKRVTGWYEYTWERNKGIDVLNVFNDLPTNFRAEVALSVNEEIIEKVPIFRGTSLGFKRMLSIAMRINFFTADTYIVHRGEIGKEMFFVVQGRVDVLNHDESKPLSSMVEGSYFGEYMLILGHLCEASAKAVCNCDVYVLSKDDYDQACTNYPEDASRVLAATKDMYQKQLEKQQRFQQRKKSTDDLSELFGDDDHGGGGDGTAHGSTNHVHGGARRSSSMRPTKAELDDNSLAMAAAAMAPAGLILPANTGPGARRPSFGYFVMDEDDQRRIEQQKIEKRRKSAISVARFNAQAHSDRVAPIDDGVRHVGTITRGSGSAAGSPPGFAPPPTGSAISVISGRRSSDPPPVAPLGFTVMLPDDEVHESSAVAGSVDGFRANGSGSPSSSSNGGNVGMSHYGGSTGGMSPAGRGQGSSLGASGALMAVPSMIMEEGASTAGLDSHIAHAGQHHHASAAASTRHGPPGSAPLSLPLGHPGAAHEPRQESTRKSNPTLQVPDDDSS